MSRLTRDGWVDAHVYLRPVARLCARVEGLAAEVVAGHESPRLPAWDDYQHDFREGIPLFRSAAAAIDLEPAGRMTASLVGRVASDSVDGALGSEATALDARCAPDPTRRASSRPGCLGRRRSTPRRRGSSATSAGP